MNPGNRDDGCDLSLSELLHQVRQRDVTALARLYIEMGPLLRRYAASKGWRGALAEDIVHEVFLRVWQNPDRLDGLRSPKAYLLSIQRNVMRELRRAAGHAAVPINESIPARKPDPSAEAQRRELLQELASARSKLSAEHRAAVDLFYNDQLTARQSAERLRCNEHVVRLRLSAARRKLRQMLEADPRT